MTLGILRRKLGGKSRPLGGKNGSRRIFFETVLNQVLPSENHASVRDFGFDDAEQLAKQVSEFFDSG